MVALCPLSQAAFCPYYICNSVFLTQYLFLDLAKMSPMITKALRLLCCFLMCHGSGYGEGKGHPEFAGRVSATFIIHSGMTFSAALGFWQQFNNIQPSANINATWSLGQRNIGNCEAFKQKSLFNITFSPMFTFGLLKRSTYEELNPYYFGYASAVTSNFASAATIGSIFYVTPKGYGANIMTSRNRSQQLMYIQLRHDWNQGRNGLIVNISEDYLSDFFAFEPFMDRRDRYFTGGLNLQFKYDRYYRIKYYTDCYTGDSYSDRMQYPDIVYNKSRLSGNAQITDRYAFQDPGQRLLNQGRNLIAFEFPGQQITPQLQDGRYAGFQTNIQIVIGLQGGTTPSLGKFWGNHMFLQDKIHNRISIDKNGSDSLEYSTTHLHHFYRKPDQSLWKTFIFGGSINFNPGFKEIIR